MKTIFSALSLLLFTVAHSQLNIQSGATFFIQSGGKVTVQGDVTSNADIQGTGTLTMAGSALQTINMNGFTIPNLEINNASDVKLGTGATKVSTTLTFTNGRLKAGSQDVILGSSATTVGQGAGKFVWTDGTGQLKKELTGAVSNYTLPVGENGNYRPAILTTTAGTYAAGANVGVRMLTGTTNKPPMIANYVTARWPVTKTGISGTAAVTLTGQYLDADITGTESLVRGYFYNGTDWSSASEAHDAATNQISAPVTGASGELGGMSKFLAVGARAFLQGAYVAANSMMSDNLRSLGATFPHTDPYRSAPFTTAFAHTQNPTAETINDSVLADHTSTTGASNNIVDWVFVELRNTNASPGNTVLETRAALLQRDGDIVDIDGVSPVTFNTTSAVALPDATYAISVRHRNHLGLSINPSTSGKPFSEKSSTAYSASNVIDLRTATQAQLYGTAANHTTASSSFGTVNLLWGGNSNLAGTSAPKVAFTGLNNDKDGIVIPAGSPTGLTNVYHVADVNMNKKVSYTGLTNDKDFLYLTVCGSSTTTQRLQSLPN